MFGHRGLWRDGWKAVAFHPPGKPFDQDEWELFHLDADFSETNNLAKEKPELLAELQAVWRSEAERNQVLPLDDRFGERFAENAARYHGERRKFIFHAGVGHVPTDVAPDVRSRSYAIEADVEIPASGAEGVLIAHGDSTSGYTLFVEKGRLSHVLNIGGHHVRVDSTQTIPPGDHILGVRAHRLTRIKPPRFGEGQGLTRYELTIDGAPAGAVETPLGFVTLISWSGLDIGHDRGNPVGDYAAPFSFTGFLRKVSVTMHGDQTLDGEALANTEMARQ
jgi:arylsulfatase